MFKSLLTGTKHSIQTVKHSGYLLSFNCRAHRKSTVFFLSSVLSQCGCPTLIRTQFFISSSSVTEKKNINDED